MDFINAIYSFVANLLSSLGVNDTYYVEFGLFLAVYLTLKYVLFGPYFAAYNQRNDRTVGQTELAERFVNETRELEERFSKRAQEVNERFKAVFDKSRSEAMKEYDRMIGEARTKAKSLVEDTRQRIGTEMETARKQLSSEVGAVSQLINHKLIGKDFNA